MDNKPPRSKKDTLDSGLGPEPEPEPNWSSRRRSRSPAAEKREEEKSTESEKMIYRKWSLLTGPPAILGGIVATVIVANYLFVNNDPFNKTDQRKQDVSPSTK
ncbi:hypothetical protein BVC80_9079g66 [Macleaya cordata]|uniref:Uncharacterized protein n=1 Tax=Macleaya cordata TaxID=56857 RepID=A0A200PUP5_MACCD|nr:hypothetical protein BVC80_9079g66 [Macleaya cordata]